MIIRPLIVTRSIVPPEPPVPVIEWDTWDRTTAQ